MSKEIKIEVDYYKNGNKRCEIPLLKGKLHGLARWWDESGKLYEESNWLNGQLHGVRRLWWYDGSIFLFECWHKNTLMVDFEFAIILKTNAPKPNKPIFSTNQFLELCQRQSFFVI